MVRFRTRPSQGRTHKETIMWIAVFAISVAVAIALSVAAVIMSSETVS
jgi:hypothetical protein